jgi:glutamate decarboxylase
MRFIGKSSANHSKVRSECASHAAGLGWVIFRERKVFNEDLIFYVNYLGGEMPTATLNFSRNAAPLAVQYYQFLRLGFDGYKRVMTHTLKNAVALRDVLVGSDYFTIINETQRIPVVAVTLDPKIKNFNEFDVSNKVREESARRRKTAHQHNVAMLLGRDIVNACKYLEKHAGSATAPALHGHSEEKTSPAKC